MCCGVGWKTSRAALEPLQGDLPPLSLRGRCRSDPSRDGSAAAGGTAAGPGLEPAVSFLSPAGHPPACRERAALRAAAPAAGCGAGAAAFRRPRGPLAARPAGCAAPSAAAAASWATAGAAGGAVASHQTDRQQDARRLLQPPPGPFRAAGAQAW